MSILLLMGDLGMDLFVPPRKATVAGIAMHTHSPAAVYLGMHRRRHSGARKRAARRHLSSAGSRFDFQRPNTIKTTTREVLLIGRLEGAAAPIAAEAPPGAILCRPTARAREGDRFRRGSPPGTPVGTLSSGSLSEQCTGNRSKE